MEINEKRNLFTYATKELSQDAFLMWLFNNYDDEEVGPVAYTLLREFCGLKGEKICNLETKAQDNNIDISVLFETNKGKYALFIEDKTESKEHDNQLLKYNKYIDTFNKDDCTVCKVYYKPGYLYDDEKGKVKEAHWGEPYDTDKIYTLLQPFFYSPNPIVKMYIEHILARKNALSVKNIPQGSQTQIDYLEWLAFFGNTVIPKLEKYFSESKVKFEFWKGPYSYVALSATYRDHENVPYLEICSRDCVGEKFKSKVLCHGVADGEKKKALCERTEKATFFSQKGIRKKEPKQIGWREEKNIKTTEEFIEAVKKSVEEYLKLMEDWDKL